MEPMDGDRKASVNVVALSGSLRANSSNTALLVASQRLAPPGLVIERYHGIADLPHFNPDLASELFARDGSIRAEGWNERHPGYAAVRELNARVRAADGVLIACPEYARGVPGAFKNALDWLVGGDGFVNKPFTLFNASPRASHAQDALRVTLETMSGCFAEEAALAVPLLNRDLDASDIVADEAIADRIRRALVAFSGFIAEWRVEAGVYADNPR